MLLGRAVAALAGLLGLLGLLGLRAASCLIYKSWRPPCAARPMRLRRIAHLNRHHYVLFRLTCRMNLQCFCLPSPNDCRVCAVTAALFLTSAVFFKPFLRATALFLVTSSFSVYVH